MVMVEGSLKTLIIDDSPTDAETLSYLLTKRLGCQVETAGNGLEGLNKLAEIPFDMVFLDLIMPLVSGVEVLSEIRAWPKTAHLPVIIISANTDAKTVQSLVQLKIFDYVIKPYHSEKLVKRFAAKFAALKSRLTIPASARLPGGEAKRKQGKEVALVVDEDANFRHFFNETMGSRYDVLEAANGAQALTVCLERFPDFVFTGPRIGIFGRDRMVAKLRAISGLAHLKVYTVDGNGEGGQADPSLYSGGVQRTFVPQAFIESVDRCLNGNGVAEPAKGGLDDLYQPLVSATEQVFGMMMSTEVNVEHDWVELDPAKPGIHGAIDLVSYQERKRIVIEFHCDRASVEAMAMRMLQMDKDEAEKNLEDARSSLAEVLNIIGGRMNNSLGEGGREFFLGLPRVEEQTVADGAAAASKRVEANFSAADGIHFSIGARLDNLSACLVATADIREGMVLARAVDFGGGMQLSKGRRLDAGMIAEIGRSGVGEIEVFEFVQMN